MRIKVTHTKYRMQQVWKDGEKASPTQLVSDEFVISWLGGADYFNNLVDVNEIHLQDKNAVITVRQVNPEGRKRLTTFTPLGVKRRA